MSARLVVLGIATAAIVLGGCRVGSTTENVRPARNPEGARAVVHVRNGLPLHVELLTADDSVLTVLHRDSVKELRWSRIARINVDQLDDYRPPFDGDDRSRLRLVSRFPYGISAEVMAALLARAGQNEPAVE